METNINLKEEIKTENNFFKILRNVLIVITAIILLFYIYIRFVEPKIITVEEKALISDAIPNSFNGFKIVFFSDILYGTTINDKNIEKVINKINELDADIIIFNGDLFNQYINYNDNNYEILKNNLSNIKASLKKLAVMGDQDYKNKEKYESIMNDSGFKILNNEVEYVFYKDNTPLMIVGVPSLLQNDTNLSTNVDLAIDTANVFKILVGHEPIIIDKAINSDFRPNIILAGHTLNGLVKIPFSGYLLNQDGENNYKEKFYHKYDMDMYISNGLGTYKYNIRFLNNPTINLFRLYNH